MACLIAAGGLRAGDALPSGAAIEFSEPSSSFLATNLNLIQPLDFSGQGREEQPEKPSMVNFGSARSGGALAPLRPGTLAPPSRRSRSSIESDTGWLPLSSDDAVQNYITLQILKNPHNGLDQRQVESLTAAGRLLGYLPREMTARNSQDRNAYGRTGGAFGAMEGKGYSGADFRNGYDNADSLIKGLTAPDSGSSRSALSDWLQPKDNGGLSPEAIRVRKAQEQHLEDYRKFLGLEVPSAPTFSSPFEQTIRSSASATPVRGYSQPASPGLFETPKPLVNANNSPLRPPATPLTPLAPHAPIAPGQLSSLDETPAYTPPVVPRPSFSAPKRSF